jgi:2-dehydro-3-deoxyphosphooctonate aldolase (KDO 8-P synthase)
MVEPLARAAMAIGADGLFCETHPDPDRSPSDGPNMIPLQEFGPFLKRLLEIRSVISGLEPPVGATT